ncbi:MAG TPA: DUF883 family protein [Cellvibrio sp.]|nr:DUF883 family protein [Cellvibrio sp.]
MQITSSNSAANSKLADAKAEASTSASALAREFRSFVSDVEDLLKATTNLTGDDLTKAKAKLNQRIASAKGSVEDVSGVIASRARKAAETTDTYVHEQPWTAIGAGAAAGVLIGFLLSRRW